MQSMEKAGGFSLSPRNLEEAMKLADMICNTDIVPKNYRGKPGDTLVAMMLGSEVGLNPLQSLSNIAVINGRPSIWGDAMLALCQKNPHFVSITETFDDATMTATCTVKRKNNELHTVTFSQADAEKAGLWQTQETVTRTNYKTKEKYTTDNDSPWWKYPKRMLQMRARGFALRDQFADSLHGLITREEAQDIIDITDEATVESVTRNPPQQTSEPEPGSDLLPTYTDQQFNDNFPAFEELIKTGRKTPAQIIYTVQGKYTLTDEQKTKINGVKRV